MTQRRKEILQPFDQFQNSGSDLTYKYSNALDFFHNLENNNSSNNLKPGLFVNFRSTISSLFNSNFSSPASTPQPKFK